MSDFLTVKSSTHAYEVHLGLGVLARCGDLIRHLPTIRRGMKCAVVTDANVALLHAQPLLATLDGAGFEAKLVVVPAGEASKLLDQVAQVAEACAEFGLNRQSFIVALGGGGNWRPCGLRGLDLLPWHPIYSGTDDDYRAMRQLHRWKNGG